MSTANCGCSAETCDCCQAIRPLTPLSEVNRPGLDAIRYRAGTHGAFLETMKARLASTTFEALGPDGQTSQTFTPLLDLTTRDPSDFSIALLDGWATVADVLTFYQERLANEGYLRTATERRSVVDLARLIGYQPRPGVAATVYLAYTLDDNQTTPVDIPAGARSQSIPGPGELPQSFETSEVLTAQSEWSNLKPRMTQPQSIKTNGRDLSADAIYFKGTTANLKPSDPLLFKFSNSSILRHVKTAEADVTNDWTKVTLQEATITTVPAESKANGSAALARKELAKAKAEAAAPKADSFDALQSLVQPLSLPPSLHPAASAFLPRSLQAALGRQRDTLPALLGVLKPQVASTIYAAWAHSAVTDPQPVRVFALRLTSSLFGASTPRRIIELERGTGKILRTGEWPVLEGNSDDDTPVINLKPAATNKPPFAHETVNVLDLEGAHDEVLPGSWIVVQTADTSLTKNQTIVAKAATVQSGISRADYGMSGKVTRIQLTSDRWITTDLDTAVPNDEADFAAIRQTRVSAQSEELHLAEQPYQPDLEGEPGDVQGQRIELARLYAGLKSGRWLIVSGERTDVKGIDNKPVSGVTASELVMIAGIEQTFDPSLPGDQVHTALLLSQDLAYTYKRKTVTLYGNVVKATHGETRNEALGSGDGSQPLQSFDLKQPPLTFVSAPTAAGAQSTLKVFVNEVEWHEADTLAGLGPKDRSFITQTADDGSTTVIFGNGKQGARLPTGQGNIKAVYRNGIGRPGNVIAGQISLLQTQPLGVKSVLNPLRASGGADKETRDEARKNAPLAVMSLDRLVSVQDYSEFTRTFAGIAKATAECLSDSAREVVYLTIAGAADAPIDFNSDLYHNLLAALRRYGDPALPVKVATRELLLLLLSVGIKLLPDHQWEPVVQSIRQALLDTFSFAKRDLGQPVRLSEVVSVIQAVEGVAYVDVDSFDAIGENFDPDGLKERVASGHIQDPIIAQPARPNPNATGVADALLPAQIIYLTPQVADTLVLNPIS